MRTQWVHQLRNCPDAEDVEVLAEEEGRPRQILARPRPGDDALVDGYVLQRVDTQAHTAVYTWVRTGDPETVTEYLLDLLAKVYPRGKAR
ncbi:hypothetical protein [Kitasatospora indigofera]|uniref:hypothetical protein n=1 Tax=Kitasatospora indigofera TaxID=67307 RepID=UPI0036B72126